jgi:hypothetical protein
VHFTAKNGFLALLLLLCVHSVFCQEADLLELLLNSDQESEYGEMAWIENLWVLTQHPINLNDADPTELSQLPFLTARIANNIIKFRDSRKNFSAMEELLQIEGVTLELLDALRPFIYIGPVNKPPSLIYRVQGRLEYPRRKGYLINSYHNPLYLQQRLLFSDIKNCSGGIIWEKDAGEEHVFDYGSFFITYAHPTQKFTLTLGDFYQKVGVGLMLWTPYGTPLSIYALPSYRSLQSSFKGNQSTRETGFLRGIALKTNPWPWISFEMFYSKNQWDGNISDNMTNSIYFQGLHRTSSEKMKINRIQSEIYGGTVSGNRRFLHIESSVIIQQFHPRFYQKDVKIQYLGFAHHWNSETFQQGGELALSETKFPAIQQYLNYSYSTVKWEFIGYYYHPQYFTVLGRRFGSFQQTPQNIYGSAMILQYRLKKHFLIGGYYHAFRKIHSTKDNPFIRRDYLLEVKHQMKFSEICLQLKMKFNEVENETDEYAEKNVNALRLEYIHKNIKNFKLRTHLQIHWINQLTQKPKEMSVSLFQQIEWEISGWRFMGRWSTFDIPDYDLRIYEYENDLPGNFRSVLLNGRGYKIFFLCQKKISNHLQIDFKYGNRYYPDQTTIGSGLDEIPHNRAHDFRMSLIWRILP